MTILNGVIDVEDQNSSKKEFETSKSFNDSLVSEIITIKDEKDSNSVVITIPSREEDVFPILDVSFEPSKANENKFDAAIPLANEIVDEDSNAIAEYKKKYENEELKLKHITELNNSNVIMFYEKYDNIDCNSRIWNRKKKEVEQNLRSLTAIILDRLSDRQDEASNHDLNKEIINSELQIVCQELLNDILNKIIQTMNPSVQKIVQNKFEPHSDNSIKSVHCSLPLEKIASVLETCNISNSLPQQLYNVPLTIVQSKPSKIMSSPYVINKSLLKSLIKPTSVMVKHLCLYCDRKFLSISLRQRHIERVHQTNGGRRSERNSRKISQQNCQYCMDKCSENLESLFQHMVGSHSDKYHGCLQCCTRYLNRDALTLHIRDVHSYVTVQMEKLKEPIVTSIKEIKAITEDFINVKEEPNTIIKQSLTADQLINTSNLIPENSFYNNVSCNIQENLLHHIDGKIQVDSSSTFLMSLPVCSLTEFLNSNNKMALYESSIDISRTAITPICNKDYSMPLKNNENSSEHAGKPSKLCTRMYPRRISFEKYNFPRKYDVKEEWNCSIKDLSKFDILTQIMLHKKQNFIKECTSFNRLEKLTLLPDNNQRTKDKKTIIDNNFEQGEKIVISSVNDGIFNNVESEKIEACHNCDDKKDNDGCKNAFPLSQQTLINEPTVFSSEFENFMRLKKWNKDIKEKKNCSLVYAELTGEWSRPRIYICGACAARYITLKELEEHKSLAHPNVWCIHFEFSGDQRELYQHLMFLPGQNCSRTGNIKTRQQTNNNCEKVCTKCAKNCASFAELHRHMLECGGDQTWLLGLFGNSKKKCKWRPFGSRSRRRRQRGMKRNIQNSQTCRSIPKEKQPSNGPRVRPSDHESIQKMLANLPAKRITRKVLQENSVQSHGRLRNMQSQSINKNSRMLKNKEVLRNKLVKNAKFYQHKKNFHEEEYLENEAKITYEEHHRVVRSTRPTSKRKVSLESIASEPSNTNQIVKDDDRPCNSPYTIPMSNKTILKNSNSIKKKGSPVILESDTNLTSKINRKHIKDLITITPKSKKQLGIHDNKFSSVNRKNLSEFDRKSIKISRRSRVDSSHLFTRSKLRTAAKIAWKEHVKISHPITRFRSLNMDKMITEPKLVPPVVKTNLIEHARLKFSRTGSRNLLSSQQNLNGIVIGTATEKMLENVSSGNREETLPNVSKSKRVKQNTLINAKSCTNMSENKLINKYEQIKMLNKPKTRSNKSEYLKIVTQTKPELKTKRVITYKNEMKKTNTDLFIKTEKDRLFSTLIKTANEGREIFNSTFKSNPKIEKDIKKRNEYSIESKNKKISASKEIYENKISKRIKKNINKNLAIKVVKTSDFEAKHHLFSSLKKEKVKRIALRKSPRNKQTDVKEIVNETKIEKGLSSKFIEANNKNNTMKFVNENLSEKYLEKNVCIVEEKSISNVSIDKSITLKRRGRINRNVRNIEKTKPTKSSLHDQENKIDQLRNLNEAEENSSTSKINTEKTLLSISSSIKIDNNLQDLSLVHLQSQFLSSNINSGKENSSGTNLNVSKLKVVRPKKWKGYCKDNKAATSKKSHNGILTEGVNVPITTQDTSAILTLQTNIKTDNNNLIRTNENNNEITAENSSFTLDKIINKSTEIFNLDNKIKAATLNELKNLNDEKIQKLNKNYKSEDDTTKEDLQNNEGNKEQNVNVKIESNLVTEQPENDIILDLSRRRLKEKGSFLEKIVSKIAKQKHVFLDSGHNYQLYNESALIETPNNLENEEKIRIQEWNSNNQVKHIKNENIIRKKINVKDLLEYNINIKNEILNNIMIQINSNTNINSEELLSIYEEVNKIEKTENSKKRPIENNFLKKNKKKIIYNEEVQEKINKKEINLMDIMKLIPEQKSKEILNVEQSSTKSNKKKLSDDDIEFDTNNKITSNSCKLKRNRKIITKSKHNKYKKTKNNIGNMIDQNITKKNNNINNSEINFFGKQNKTGVNLNNTNDGDEIIEQEKSVNIIEPINEVVNENKTVKLIKIDTKNNETKAQIVKKSTKEECLKLNENVNDYDKCLQKSKFKISSNLDKRKKKNSKNPRLIVQSFKRHKISTVLIDDLSKNSNLTKLTKAKKKRIMSKKSNINFFDNIQELKKQKYNPNIKKINDKLKIDYNGLGKHLLISKSKQGLISNYTLKRHIHNSKQLISSDMFMNIRKSVYSNRLSSNKLQGIKRNRLHRKNLIIFNNDKSINFIDETVSFNKNKVKNKHILGKTILKNISISNKSSKVTCGDKLSEKNIEDDILKNKINEINENGDQISNIPIFNTNSLNANFDKSNKHSSINSIISCSKHDESVSVHLQTSEKQLVDDFEVVAKSDKIMIVQKKKKLTKEVAKFFCNICTTSFTRKSSLKKHNLSQSHILQMAQDSKIKEHKKNQNLSEICEKSKSFMLDSKKIIELEKEKEAENKEESNSINLERKKELKKILIDELDKTEINKTTENEIKDFKTNDLIISKHVLIHKSPEEELEDEMLDEEICKITENMSHDEYVLTDHMSPITPHDILTSIKDNDICTKEIQSFITMSKTTFDATFSKIKNEETKNLIDEHFVVKTPISTNILESTIISNINNVQNASKDTSVLKKNFILNETEVSTFTENSKNINKEVIVDKNISVNSSIKNKSNLEKRITANKIRYVHCNKNQNIGFNLSNDILKHSRPKRYKSKRNYNEDENFDFDMIESCEKMFDERQETSIPKRNKSGSNPNKIIQSNYEDENKKQKEILKTKINELDTDISQSKISNVLKNDLNKKLKIRKSQIKKKINDLNHTKSKNLILNLKKNINKRFNTSSISKSILKKSERNNSKLGQKDQSIEQKMNISMKKRGRKPRKSNIKKDADIIKKCFLSKNEKIPVEIIETITQNKTNIVQQKFCTNSKSESTEQQDKKYVYINDEVINIDSGCKVDKITISKILLKEKKILESKQKIDEIKLQPNVFLESLLEVPINTLTEQSKQNVSSIPTESSHFAEIMVTLPKFLINKITDDAKQLIFPKVNVDNFKIFDNVKNKLMVPIPSRFDTDDNSLNSKMSPNIQKLLHDPKMTTEILKQSYENIQDLTALNNIKLVDDITSKKSTFKKSTYKKSLKFIKPNEKIKLKHHRDIIVDRKSKKNHCKLMNESSKVYNESEIEVNIQKNIISKNKFEHAFFNEKIDKVHNVIDDSQLRSKLNVSDNKTDKLVMNYRSKIRKSSQKTSSVQKLIESHNRYRKSKKIAEELISRTFNDSPILNKNDIMKIQRLAKKNKKLSLNSFEKTFSNYELGQVDNISNNPIEIKQMTLKSNRRRGKNNIKEAVISIIDLQQSKYKQKKEIVEEVIDKPKEIQVSQLIVEQENIQLSERKKANNEFNEDEEEKLKDKALALYTRNSRIDENNFESSTNNKDNDINQECKKRKLKSKKKKLLYSINDKILLKSLNAKSIFKDSDKKIKLLTIGATDATKNNALNLEMSSVEKNNTEKSSPATKVLNFDEELFVECCSRLKATSEKELRGTKKIKLDNSTDQIPSNMLCNQYHRRKDEQLSGFKGGINDRWRDVESKNNLENLLESVNQLLGEEYNSYEKEYSFVATKHEHYNHHYRHDHYNQYNNGHSTRSIITKDKMELKIIDDDNMSNDDSLNVAFEHNNKLRDKIQRRMHESENLITTSFNQKTSNIKPFENYLYDGTSHAMSSNLSGLLDKALLNLFYNNEKYDHNVTTPMKLLAELACARAPTSTSSIIVEKSSNLSPSRREELITLDKYKQQEFVEMFNPEVITIQNSKNSIKELFQHKRELYKKNQLEQMKVSDFESRENFDLPIIRITEYRDGMTQKRYRDTDKFLIKNKKESMPDRTMKDVYDFDEEENINETKFSTVLSYRAKPDVSKKPNMSSLISKTIENTLNNDKSIGESLETMVDCKFNSLEKFDPESNINKKMCENHLQRSILGSMDKYIDKKQRSKGSSNGNRLNKQCIKLKKKRGKNSKKKSRNAWYEDDSSDEFVTKLKADNIGVGISKTQRTCSKGKQNLFAEMSSTSSESEYDVSEKELRNKNIFINDKSRNSDEDKKSKSEPSNNLLVMDEKSKNVHNIEQHTLNDNETEERRFGRNYHNSIINSDQDMRIRENKSSLVLMLSETSLLPLSKNSGKTGIEKYIVLEKGLEMQNYAQKKDLKECRLSNKNFFKEKKLHFKHFQKQGERDLPGNKKHELNSENLPLHVFLSRKVQESKNRKQRQQLKKLKKEQERRFLQLQPTRHQRKCAEGKQGLLAEISSSDEDICTSKKISNNKPETNERQRNKQKHRESKEKLKERYVEKKHEKMIAKEQKAIEETIMRELKEKRQSITTESSFSEKLEEKAILTNVMTEIKTPIMSDDELTSRNYWYKQRLNVALNNAKNLIKCRSDVEKDTIADIENVTMKSTETFLNSKNKKVISRKPHTIKKSPTDVFNRQRHLKNRPISFKCVKKVKEQWEQQPDTFSGKRKSDLKGDKDLKTTKSWNKVDEGIGVAIGRRKRAAANQLYYWSSSSDEEEMQIASVITTVTSTMASSITSDIQLPPGTKVDQENHQEVRLKQHGWIVGDSHKKMITMLAMEKQMKEKRRRSENDVLLSGDSLSTKTKNKEYRNSTF